MNIEILPTVSVQSKKIPEYTSEVPMDSFFPDTSEHSNLGDDFGKEDIQEKYEGTSNVETSDTNGFEPSFQTLKEDDNVCSSVSSDDHNIKEGESSGASLSSNEPTKPTSRRGRKPSSLKNRAHRNNQNRGLQSSPVIKDPSSGRHTSRSRGGAFMLPEKHNIGKDFIEPALAEPRPIYTGLCLESFPSAKVKKESLWPSKNTEKRPGRSSNSSNEIKEGKTVSDKNDEENKHLEEKYKSNLQTEVFEEIVTESSARNSVNGKPTKGRPGRPPSKGTVKTPKQSKHPHSSENSSLRSSKRIKVISPKKPGTTNLAPGAKERALWGSNDEQTQSNDDFCSACGGSGVFICCDTCPKSYHFLCCEPPLEDCPDDNWNCPECVYKRNPNDIRRWDDIGMFGKLLNQQESRGVKEFQLPNNLRDHTFVGVSTGEGGVYQDDTVKHVPSSNKNDDSQVPGFNTNVDLEIDSLYDKEGKPYLCHKCGLSGLNRRTIIRCDYCPLAWHLDCLDYPLTTPKPIGNKWRCPNHYEELLSRQLMNRRDFKDANVIDVSLQHQFLKIAALGKLLIKETGQPYLKENDDSPFTLREYLHRRKEHLGISNSRTFDTKEKGDGDTKNENKITYVPSYLQNYSNECGVTAKASNRLSRIITLTDVDDDNDCKSKAFIYRIPEKLVLLDFMSKAAESRSQTISTTLQGNGINTGSTKGHSIKKNILDSVEEYKARGRLDNNREDRDFVDGLSQFSHVPKEKPQPRLSHLIDAIMAVNNSEAKAHHTIDDGELDDLRSIKRLIEVKGRESLLQYLNS